VIEGGGTRFRCERWDAADRVLAQCEIPTTTPEETLRAVVEFFSSAPVAAVGLACFGPLGVERGSSRFGRILATPKPGWSDADVVGTLERELRAPVHFHTDVIGAALGEWLHGSARGARCVLYVTVGTGVGGGALLDGQPIGGAGHAEIGHIGVKRARGDAFVGACPFHGDCLEGLIAGPALKARTGHPGESLPIDHPAIELAADTLGAALGSLALSLSPDVIVVGGGVMRDGALLPRVRTAARESLHGYFDGWRTAEAVERRIVSPGLAGRSALVGARELIRRAAR